MSAIPITNGTGQSSVAAETVAGISYQQIEVYGAGGASVLSVDPSGAARVSVVGTISASVIGTVPVVQSGIQITSVSGSLNVLPYITSLVSGVSSIISTTSITAVLGSAPSAQRNYITQIIATNAAATGTFVDVRDGTTVIYSGFAAASGGGFSASFPTPLRQSSIAAVVDIQTSAQASVKVAIVGFTAA